MSAWGPPAGSLCWGHGSAQQTLPGQDLEEVPSTPLPGDSSHLRPLPTCTRHLCHLLLHPPRCCTVPQARERTDQKQTGQPRGAQGVGGAARPPRPSLEAQGAALQEGHLLLQECRGEEKVPGTLTPSSLPPGRLPPGWASGGQAATDGRRELGRRRLPQAPVCEASARRDRTAWETEREAGASDPAARRRQGPGSPGMATCPPARCQLPRPEGRAARRHVQGRNTQTLCSQGSTSRAFGAAGRPGLEPSQAGRGPGLHPNQRASARCRSALLGQSRFRGPRPQLCGDCGRTSCSQGCAGPLRGDLLPGVRGATVSL